jgi:hypothetical protein
MKYTTEILNKLIKDYNDGKTAAELARELTEKTGELVPERSVIAKLSSIGVYKRKEYVNKRGEAPTTKEEYIKRIANLLDINTDLLESMEKTTKTALMLIERQIRSIRGD